MAKKLISVWLSLTVLLFSTITIYADDSVQGQFLNRNIDINGNRIANYYLEDPLFLYQGVTYFPLSQEMEPLLGFDAEMDWESRTLTVTKKEPTKTALDQETLKSNLQNPVAVTLTNVTVIKRTKNQGEATLPSDLFRMREYSETKMNLDDHAVLQVGQTLYLPLRALSGDDSFGWSIFYDDYSGLYVSTDVTVDAALYFDAAEADYNRGLAAYITAKNSAINKSKALMLVFLFKHEAEINDVNERLLMAMAQKESTFRTDAVGSGAVGIMQIMPATAERFGIQRSQLLDAHINIEFGSKYIGDKILHYGDTVTALSAYNQGGAAISRGSYTTRYANKISGAEDTLESYLVKNGYGLGN
ncbi:MAG: transglycosylase SLT domain-containing protein [Eubacteriales bacterium]|nr:transglycosylase SLT domain-containing protein [Eubacteriales bacterium]